MRINRYVAAASGLSRRQADKLIIEGRVRVNNQTASTGQEVDLSQKVTLNDQILNLPTSYTTVMFNKPKGYVVSRSGQNNLTIYDLLPKKYSKLKPVGRLDKDSTGLLLLTNDGQLIQQLAHPSSNKIKIYLVKLDNKLSHSAEQQIKNGVILDDGVSNIELLNIQDRSLRVGLGEGRKRQIRRTFEAIGYKVEELHRTDFGQYSLGKLANGEYKELNR